MKNWKWFKVFGIAIIFVMGFGFIGCDPEIKEIDKTGPEKRDF